MDLASNLLQAERRQRRPADAHKMAVGPSPVSEFRRRRSISIFGGRDGRVVQAAPFQVHLGETTLTIVTDSSAASRSRWGCVLAAGGMDDGLAAGGGGRGAESHNFPGVSEE